jgi:hypothetical protein
MLKYVPCYKVIFQEAIFCDVTLCSLVEISSRMLVNFWVKMKAAHSAEASINSYGMKGIIYQKTVFFRVTVERI